jgi:translation elongation factor EF-Ts
MDFDSIFKAEDPSVEVAHQSGIVFRILPRMHENVWATLGRKYDFDKLARLETYFRANFEYAVAAAHHEKYLTDCETAEAEGTPAPAPVAEAVQPKRMDHFKNGDEYIAMMSAFLAAHITQWTGVVIGGKAVDYSFASATDLLTRNDVFREWVSEQVQHISTEAEKEPEMVSDLKKSALT